MTNANRQGQRPDVYRYSDYRMLLRDFFHYQQGLEPQFSFRKLSERAGFSSPNFFQLVYQGKRNLGPTSIIKLAKAFKWTRAELAFIEVLVGYDQTTETDLKAQFFERLQKLRPRQSKVQTIDHRLYEYYSDWTFVLLREMVGLTHFNERPAKLSRQMNGIKTPRQIELMLKQLEVWNLLARTSNGKLQQSASQIATAPEVTSMAIFKFHQKMMELAQEALTTLPSAERDISGATFAMDRRALPELKKKIRQFRLHIMEWAESHRTKDQVLQLNVQAFPLLKAEVEKSI